MQAVWLWLQANWLAVTIVILALMKVLNKITEHWGEYTGLRRWCLFLVDLLDIIKSTPPPGARKNGNAAGSAALDALVSLLAAVALALLIVGFAAGCGGWQGRARISLETIHQSGQALEALATPAYKIRCEGEARDCAAAKDQICKQLTECQEERRTVGAWLDLLDSAVVSGYTALLLEQEQTVADRIKTALDLVRDLDQMLRKAKVLP